MSPVRQWDMDPSRPRPPSRSISVLRQHRRQEFFCQPITEERARARERAWTSRTINNEVRSELDNEAVSSRVRDASRGILVPADRQKTQLQSERGSQDPTEG